MDMNSLITINRVSFPITGLFSNGPYTGHNVAVLFVLVDTVLHVKLP